VCHELNFYIPQTKKTVAVILSPKSSNRSCQF
jgi:hypothetical protein